MQQQDVEEFRTLVRRTLAVDPNGVPEWRVANTLAQRRATWLDARVSDLFVSVEGGDVEENVNVSSIR